MNDSICLTAVTALARALHKEGVLNFEHYLTALATAALASQKSDDQPAAEATLEYIRRLKAFSP